METYVLEVPSTGHSVEGTHPEPIVEEFKSTMLECQLWMDDTIIAEKLMMESEDGVILLHTIIYHGKAS